MKTALLSRKNASGGRSWGGSWGRSKSTQAKNRRRRERLEDLRASEEFALADWPPRPYLIQTRERHRTEVQTRTPPS
jgi:hypothetical protein